MREAKRKGEERRGEGALSSLQRRHREPLLPSTAFQCKHCHPICDRVNWFFDVSRKVLIEKKKKKGTRIFLSPRTPVYLLKKKKSCCSQRASFRPFPSHPSLSQIPTTSLLSYITAFLGVMVVFFFFEGTNFNLLISQLKKKKKMWECSRLPAATADQMEQQGQCLLIWEAI